MVKKAVILFSGGLDSATVLYLAQREGYRCRPIVFDYGQRHRREIISARRIARAADVPCEVLKVPFPRKSSSLTDPTARIPLGNAGKKTRAIPSTYVPARNIVFLSLAVSFAESIGAEAVFIGANAVDFSDYPDCRPMFYTAFRRTIVVGTKSGTEGRSVKILAPLLYKTKAEIVKLGFALGVPYRLTWSCYQGGRRPCGRCDSCAFRAKGFREAGRADPLVVAAAMNGRRGRG